MLLAGEHKIRPERNPGELEPEVAIAFLGKMRPPIRQARWRFEGEEVPLVQLVTLSPAPTTGASVSVERTRRRAAR